MDRPSSPSRDARPAASKPGPAGAPAETGWLPDCVYTGEKFESGMAFFADGQGRITRFSREPADLAAARRLAGQAALPGLVNTHSHAFHRTWRGRTEVRGRGDRDPLAPWREAHDAVAGRLTPEQLHDVARMTFMEMLLAGITCVGEFHYLHQQPDGAPWPEPNLLAQTILRAAHEVGIRIALLNCAWSRGSYRPGSEPAPARFATGGIERFVRETEVLHRWASTNFPADEAWIGVAAAGLGQVPLNELKALGNFAHSQRFRLHVPLATTAAENAACQAEFGRTPAALLAEHGLIDKRFTAIDAAHLTADEIKLLGAARATVCVCPLTAASLGQPAAPVEALLAAGAGLAVGTDSQGQIDLLKEARHLEYDLRSRHARRPGLSADPATTWWHAATVTGARSLGATGGALEVGRPADFFTVNLFEPSLAGTDPASLLANVVFALERRAIRDVWIGARQRVANGRHQLHGAIVGRFVDTQTQLWPRP